MTQFLLVIVYNELPAALDWEYRYESEHACHGSSKVQMQTVLCVKIPLRLFVFGMFMTVEGRDSEKHVSLKLDQ